MQKRPLIGILFGGAFTFFFVAAIVSVFHPLLHNLQAVLNFEANTEPMAIPLQKILILAGLAVGTYLLSVLETHLHTRKKRHS